MSNPLNRIDQTTDNFEREKWIKEISFREREIALKEAEQLNRAEELRLKENESERSKWSSPLVVAISAAALAGIVNASVAGLNGYFQREVEELKSESARILEMIKTGNTKSASGNLKFLMETGLIINSD